MTITYNLGIPAGSHSPSVDQPNMQANNDAIASYVAIDHVAFGSAGSGKHNQVTFNSNNVPALPTIPPVLFTNTPSGLSLGQLFFYSGADTASSTQYNTGNSAANGSTFLFGGMILKWGHAAKTNTSQNWTDALIGQVAFPNNCFAMIVNSTDSAYANSLAVTALSKTAFTVTRSNGAGDTGYYYIAIGN